MKADMLPKHTGHHRNKTAGINQNNFDQFLVSLSQKENINGIKRSGLETNTGGSGTARNLVIFNPTATTTSYKHFN
jgi:hypothetical protein